jgi:hypothetical protein
MNLFLCSAALLIAAQTQGNLDERDRHPLAPSLPRLTKAESAKIDQIIERFIQYDIGKLNGVEGKKALDDFNRLGPEAIFNLINGLNRAANMESSCPAVIIAKKVTGILTRSQDLHLLTYAKENIGADVTAKRHLGVLSDLKTNIILRRSALVRAGVTPIKLSPYARLSLAELEKAIAGEARVPQLKSMLAEAEKRGGPKAIDLLLHGIDADNAEVAKFSNGLLANNLRRQSADGLKALLKHPRPEIRVAATQQISGRRLRYGAELIALLQDSEENVRQAARRALMMIARGMDFGPSPDASFTQREEAVARWREWWSKQR